MRIKGFNDWVACSPPDTTMKTTPSSGGGFVVPATEVKLVQMTVIFPDNEWKLSPGMSVYVPGDVIRGVQWAKSIYELEGKKFIMVPRSSIVLVSDPMGITNT